MNNKMADSLRGGNLWSVLSATLLQLVFGFVVASGFVAFADGTSASAYTCAYQGNSGSGRHTTSSGYTGKMEYKDGNCAVYEPKGSGVDSRPSPAGGRQCPNSGQKLHDDGKCYNYEWTYTNVKPTHDDGSEVPREVWDGMCGGTDRHQGGDGDGVLKYDSSRHRCYDSRYGLNHCMGRGDEASFNNPVSGVCTTIDDTAKGYTLKDEREDPTTSVVGECTKAGATWNGQTQQCNWTKGSCQAKGRGQGVWVDPPGECKVYSDFTNKEECEKNGGEFKLIAAADNDNPEDHWRCVLPGSDGALSEDEVRDADKGVTPGRLAPSRVEGVCGEGARTNLIRCEDEGGAAAFNNVLRIFVIVLSFGVGIAAVGGLAFSAIQYAQASDNEGQVSAARERIRNIVIGIFLYGFLVAIVNWLMPGGIIGS